MGLFHWLRAWCVPLVPLSEVQCQQCLGLTDDGNFILCRREKGHPGLHRTADGEEW